MQWDGQYLVIAANSVLKFYRVSVSGLNAKLSLLRSYMVLKRFLTGTFGYMEAWY